jgi:hypothetical protein
MCVFPVAAPPVLCLSGLGAHGNDERAGVMCRESNSFLYLRQYR